MSKIKSTKLSGYDRSAKRSSLVLTDESKGHSIRAMIRPAVAGPSLAELRSYGGYFDRAFAKAERIQMNFANTILAASFLGIAIYIVQK